MADPRFLPLSEVAEILNIGMPQAYALVKTKKLKAMQIGGRNVWRVEIAELEAFIQRSYAETEQALDAAEISD